MEELKKERKLPDDSFTGKISLVTARLMYSYIVKMAKDGNVSAKIGLVLRDHYGVPDVKLATGKTITQIMKEKGVAPALPEDLSNLMRRAIDLNVHLKENRGDISSKRGLMLIEARIRRLERYYKRNGVLPKDWKYSLNTAELMLK